MLLKVSCQIFITKVFPKKLYLTLRDNGMVLQHLYVLRALPAKHIAAYEKYPMHFYVLYLCAQMLQHLSMVRYTSSVP